MENISNNNQILRLVRYYEDSTEFYVYDITIAIYSHKNKHAIKIQKGSGECITSTEHIIFNDILSFKVDKGCDHSSIWSSYKLTIKFRNDDIYSDINFTQLLLTHTQNIKQFILDNIHQKVEDLCSL